jgi:hypothetical protein
VQGLPSDPRRPSEAKRYERPQFNPDTTPPDTTLLVSLFFGIMGVLMKVSRGLAEGKWWWPRRGGLALKPLMTPTPRAASQSKAASWLSLFSCLSAISSMSFETADFKQVVSAVT